jgi:hypothetical protein
MGLFERARHLADARLRSLVEPGAVVPDDALRHAILELDGYRRELVAQLEKHRREEVHLSTQVAARSAGLALWMARRALAHEHGRADLVEAASRRVERERADRDEMERRRATLQSAIANLTVSAEKVERSLRLLRAKRREQAVAGTSTGPAAGAGRAPAAAPPRTALEPSALDDPVLRSLGGGLEAPPVPEDPLEAEFWRLEHEEVARHIEGRLGPARAGGAESGAAASPVEGGGGAGPGAAPPRGPGPA